MTVRFIKATPRRGRSPRGCNVSVTYVLEGEPGKENMWLDDFLEEFADDVEVPTDE